jgi:OOP family OmpA-OmpF porin
MKKSLLTLFGFLIFSVANAQVAVDTTGIIGDSHNKWSVEFDFGQSKGAKPYAVGYFYSNPRKHIGFDINHFGIATRYMINPNFGLKTHLSYDIISNQEGSESLPFNMKHIQLSFESVVNTIRLFGIQEQAGRFGLLFHLGFQASQMSPELGPNKGKKELNGGLVAGITPQLRIFDNMSIFADFTVNSNIRQHFNWDGSYAELNNNLTGSLYTTSLGVSYSFGGEKIHGDWAIIEDKKIKELEELNNRIGDIETLMNDTDKDGVPDYLDVENNSIAGVAVDTKGRMLDKNTNGVPDELEKYIDSTISENNDSNSKKLSKGMLEQLINEGYIAAYFDTGSSQPNISSADNIGFVLTYLRNNPNASVDISGYADKVGNSAKNEKLALARAENVKVILVKAGISPLRIKAKGAGIDNSVDKDSEFARRLVRKAIFKLNN